MEYDPAGAVVVYEYTLLPVPPDVVLVKSTAWPWEIRLVLDVNDVNLRVGFTVTVIGLVWLVSPEISDTCSITLKVPALLNIIEFPDTEYDPAGALVVYEYTLLPVPPDVVLVKSTAWPWEIRLVLDVNDVNLRVGFTVTVTVDWFTSPDMSDT